MLGSLRVASAASAALRRGVPVRAISSTPMRCWDQVHTQHHAGDFLNRYLHPPQTVAVIGAPMTHGQPMLGTDTGPDQLRAAGLHQELIKLGWSVEETGNLEFDPPRRDDPMLDPKLGLAKQCFAVGKGIAKLRDVVALKAKEGKFSLVLGGDHTIGCGSVAGMLSVDPEMRLLWIDAHADINTPAESPSGNMHGMPLAFVMDGVVDASTVPGMEWLVGTPKLKPNQLVYVALRDVDAPERRLIKELGIKAFSMQEVDRYGIGRTMEMALDHLVGEKEHPLYMSYDIDAVDPVIAPSTGTRVRGGLTFREANYVAEAVAETNLLCGLDMVEVNPTLAPGNGARITIDMALQLISSTLGNRIL